MKIRNFAMTYPQLMLQAEERGMTIEERTQIKAAIQLALGLFDGLYRAQGVPFVCHLVRTASIVMAENQPVECVIAALLHAAYSDDVRSSRTDIRNAVGEKAEAMIYAYQNMPWHGPSKYVSYLENLEKSDEDARRVLIIRLANELEDYLDLGMAYRGAFPYRATIENCGAHLIRLAQGLGYATLAEELREVYRQHLERSLPGPLATNQRECYRLDSIGSDLTIQGGKK